MSKSFGICETHSLAKTGYKFEPQKRKKFFSDGREEFSSLQAIKVEFGKK